MRDGLIDLQQVLSQGRVIGAHRSTSARAGRLSASTKAFGVSQVSSPTVRSCWNAATRFFEGLVTEPPSHIDDGEERYSACVLQNQTDQLQHLLLPSGEEDAQRDRTLEGLFDPRTYVPSVRLFSEPCPWEAQALSWCVDTLSAC